MSIDKAAWILAKSNKAEIDGSQVFLSNVPSTEATGGIINISGASNSPLASVSSTGTTDTIRVTGNNMFDGELEDGTISSVTGQPAAQADRRRSKNFTRVEPNTVYKYSANLITAAALNICCYGSDYTFLNTVIGATTGTFTTPANCKYVKFFNSTTVLPSLTTPVMISKNTNTYEAYSARDFAYPSELPILKPGICNVISMGCNTLAIKYLNDLTAYKTNVVLPAEITAVVGKELSIYNQSVIPDPAERYIFKWSCTDNTKFEQLNDCIRITPATTGTYTLTLNVYDKDVLVATATSTLNVVADAVKSIKAIMIGDSFIDMGTIPAFLISEYSFESYGTRITSGANHEGRSGWTSSDYVTLATKGGVANAFWNAGTSHFDFSAYITAQGYTGINYVFINLGTNEAAQGISATTYLANLDEMIASILAYNPAMKIGLILPTQPTILNDGWGSINKTALTRWQFATSVFTLVNAAISHTWASGVFLIAAYCNVDTYYDFATTSVAVSARNPATILRSTDNVHPNTYGFYKICDAIYYETRRV